MINSSISSTLILSSLQRSSKCTSDFASPSDMNVRTRILWRFFSWVKPEQYKIPISEKKNNLSSTLQHFYLKQRLEAKVFFWWNPDKYSPDTVKN